MIVVLLFVGLSYITFSNHSVVHPGVAQVLMANEIESLECRDSDRPDSSLEAPGPSRTAGFSVNGEYHCYHPMFSASERNPYIEVALKAESLRAKRVAQSLSRQWPGHGELVGLRIEGVSDAGLRENIAAIYRVELNTVLGSGHVTHSEQGKSPVLVIRVRKVDVPELMSTAQLQITDKKGEVSWLDI